MEKPKFNRKKTMQITYPAPYSSSWNADISPALMRNNITRNTGRLKPLTAGVKRVPRSAKGSVAASLGSNGFFPRQDHRQNIVGPNYNASGPKRPVDGSRPWSKSYSAVRGPPDPTAPHLKYGVFPRRRPTSSRGLPKVVPIKPMSINSPTPVVQTPSEFTDDSFATLPFRKRPLRKAKITESPVFIFRTIDKRFTRQLSLSEIMHVDIKPILNLSEARSQPPSFCPSPNFRNTSQKLPMPPIKFPRQIKNGIMK